VDNAADDPMVRRTAGVLAADLAAAHALTIRCGELLDAFERGELGRTELAIPVYAARSAADRAGLAAASDVFTLMGTRSVQRTNGFDRYWRNVRTLSLHDPVEWKHAEIGRHVLTGWDPPPGIYT
jgi:alkylation response protein AidB-like acyl-CoA dehydrogenase